MLSTINNILGSLYLMFKSNSDAFHGFFLPKSAQKMQKSVDSIWA